MRTILPPPLAPGDRVGISAPGGPVRRDALEGGMTYLRARGFELVPGDHLRSRHAYLAGTDRERLEDLNRLIADKTVKAIWFARGGYGSARIVADVDFDSLRRNPKALIGYSDVTVLQSAAYRKARLASWHGPLVSELGDPTRFDEGSLWRALSAGTAPLAHSLPPSSVVRAGTGEGPLVGGCLSLLVSLVGTPYEAPMEGAGLRGMVVGHLVDCGAGEPQNDLALRDILETHLAGTHFPVVIDFPAGHCAGKATLPLGRTARLDTPAGRLNVEGD